MSAAALRSALAEDGVLGIVRYRAGGDVLAGVSALIDGGLRVVEVTTDTPGAFAVVAGVARRRGVVVGVGTVTTAHEVQLAADAGAHFVVSPGLVPEVLEAAQRLGLATLPGVLTGTEIVAARRLGADFCKLFPAGAVHPEYLKQLCGPFADIDFIPTGGIRPADVRDWRRAGAFAVALGSELAGRAAPASSAELAALTSRATRVLEASRAEFAV